jgi:hypothetical protein
MPVTRNVVQVYFKIPYTEICSVFLLENSLTMVEFMQYVNIEVRNTLHINIRYAIDVVDTNQEARELADALEPRADETILQRYGQHNTYLTFYARPVDPMTREFVRQVDYSI